MNQLGTGIRQVALILVCQSPVRTQKIHIAVGVHELVSDIDHGHIPACQLVDIGCDCQTLSRSLRCFPERRPRAVPDGFSSRVVGRDGNLPDHDNAAAVGLQRGNSSVQGGGIRAEFVDPFFGDDNHVCAVTGQVAPHRRPLRVRFDCAKPCARVLAHLAGVPYGKSKSLARRRVAFRRRNSAPQRKERVVNHTVKTPPVGAQPFQRKPWIRPTLQLLSVSAAGSNTGGATDSSPCPGSDQRSKPFCS